MNVHDSLRYKPGSSTPFFQRRRPPSLPQYTYLVPRTLVAKPRMVVLTLVQLVLDHWHCDVAVRNGILTTLPETSMGVDQLCLVVGRGPSSYIHLSGWRTGTNPAIPPTHLLWDCASGSCSCSRPWLTYTNEEKNTDSCVISDGKPERLGPPRNEPRATWLLC